MHRAAVCLADPTGFARAAHSPREARGAGAEPRPRR